MPLNISKGNMYPFVTHTWNTVKGKCTHDCSYCYMKKWGEQKPMRFTPGELKPNALGNGNFIFVGSSCDLFADSVKSEWIERTLNHCRVDGENKILLQSKNPGNIIGWEPLLDDRFTIGTTIETNRAYPEMGVAPKVKRRMIAMESLSRSYRTMVTVEPIMDFDSEFLVYLISNCNPSWVNIGADSGGNNLPEPSKEKVLNLIAELEKFTEVKLKKNLNRLIIKTRP